MSTVIKAGRVPGMIVELELNGGGQFSVFQIMTLAAEEIGRKRGLGRPAFLVSRTDYESGGRKTVDIPQLNGRMLAEKQGDVWVNVAWDTAVSDGDIVLVVPKIQGNQFCVSVGRVPGASDVVAIYAPGDPEGGRFAGTLAAALSAAGLELRPNEAVFVNGERAEDDTELAEGDRVVVRTAAPAATEPEAEEAAEEEYSDEEYESVDTEAEVDLGWAEDQAKTLREQGEAILAQAQRLEAALAAYRAAKDGFDSAKAEFEAVMDDLDS